MWLLQVILLLVIVLEFQLVVLVKGWYVCSPVAPTFDTDTGTSNMTEPPKQICPDGNQCCYNPIRNQYTCITGINVSDGLCCHDDSNENQMLVATGCRNGYVCANRGSGVNDGKYCQKVKSTKISNDQMVELEDEKKNDKDHFDAKGNSSMDSIRTMLATVQRQEDKKYSLPDSLPRYQLCSVQKDPTILQNIYGFPIIMNQDTTSSDGVIHHDSESRLAPLPSLAYLSNMGPIDDNKNHSKRNVDTLIIMIHGSLRNVEDCMCCINSIVERYQASSDPPAGVSTDASDNDGTKMIITPWFLSPADDFPGFSNNFSNRTKSNTQPLRWYDQLKRGMDHSWFYGADAILPVVDDSIDRNNPSIIATNISSYDAMDSILQYVHDHQQDVFPSLKRIILAGHSAGGQFVQKYALLSNHPMFQSSLDSGMHTSSTPLTTTPTQNDSATKEQDTHLTISTSDQYNIPTVSTNAAVATTRRQRRVIENKLRNTPLRNHIHLRVVVANPKSYCYFDNRRFINHRYRSLTEKEQKSCPSYNMWPWGFDDNIMLDFSDDDSINNHTKMLNSNDTDLSYHLNRYKNDAIRKVNGHIKQIIQRYRNRTVIYLQGQRDLEWNGMCSAQIQGPNRYTRTKTFYHYLQWYFHHEKNNDSVVGNEDDDYNEDRTSPGLGDVASQSYKMPQKQHYHRSTRVTNPTLKPKIHQEIIVPNLPHDHCLMFQSLLGQKTLFE
jgi:hypothetical protein